MTSVNKSYWSQPILATVKTIVEIRSACIVVYMCSWISSLFHCPYLWVRGYPLMVGLQEVPQSLQECTLGLKTWCVGLEKKLPTPRRSCWPFALKGRIHVPLLLSGRPILIHFRVVPYKKQKTNKQKPITNIVLWLKNAHSLLYAINDVVHSRQW